jgi:hypothetical protein
MQNRELPPPDGLLTQRLAAKWLGVSPRTLWGLTKNGLVATIRIGRLTLYAPEDLRRFRDKCRTDLVETETLRKEFLVDLRRVAGDDSSEKREPGPS